MNLSLILSLSLEMFFISQEEQFIRSVNDFFLIEIFFGVACAAVELERGRGE